MDQPNLPWLTLDEIRATADKARQKHWRSPSLPVDIELVIEHADIHIVPIAGLRDGEGITACISSNPSEIFVDEATLMDQSRWNSMRFTLAHEFGHICLHENFFRKFRDDLPTRLFEWARRVEKIRMENDQRFEYPANEFAGRFLVPKKALEKEIKKVDFPSLPTSISPADAKQIRSECAANAISWKFAVSESVILRRIEREEIEV